MQTYTVKDARAQLEQLIDHASESHEPVLIAGRISSAVLISEDDWRALQETLHLLSTPKLRESIRSGMAEPFSESTTELDW
jgi:prevent-host-death family protein